MLMCYKNFMYILPLVSSFFQLSENSIASASIDHKIFVLIIDYKTGVVAFCYDCIACSKHC